MKAKPMLDNWELKGLQQITIDENRAVIEHKVPGLEGSLFQDLGVRPGRISLSGSIQGDEIKEDFLEEIRKKFSAATPVPFIADITTATTIKEVIIKDLFFTEVADNTDTIHYEIFLQESPLPPEDEGSQLGTLEAELDLEANLEVEAMTQSLSAFDAGKLDDFSTLLDDLDLDDLSLDMLMDLAEQLGLTLPSMGYSEVGEVLEDLLAGAEQMLSKDIGEWASAIGTTFAEIVTKLLLTLVGGGDLTIWKNLTNSFKDTLSELFS